MQMQMGSKGADVLDNLLDVMLGELMLVIRNVHLPSHCNCHP